MPDFLAHVRERLALDALDPERAAVLMDDLAQQLDDVYLAALARGATEREATLEAHGHVRDWPTFARDLVAANPGSLRPSLDRSIARLEDAPPRSDGRGSRFARSLEQVRLDALHGLRQALARPGFTAVALVTLALGIGVNTAMFSVMRSLVRGPAAVPDPDRLVVVRAEGPARRPMSLDGRAYHALRGQDRRFAEVVALERVRATLGGIADPLTVAAVRCTRDFVTMLGLAPLAGRLPAPSDFDPGAPPVVTISERLWRRAFGADPNVAGREILVDGVAHTVTGVLADSDTIDGLARAPFELLLPFNPGVTDPPSARPSYQVIARLAPGVTREQAESALAAVASALPRDDAVRDPVSRFGLQPLEEFLVPFGRRVMSMAFLALVGVILLIACVNLASMFIARSAARGREFAVRMALGASAGRVTAQLLTESLFIALAGGALGALAGAWAVGLVATIDDAPLYVRQAASINASSLAYAFVLCATSALAFGLGPALLTARAVTRADSGLRGAWAPGSTPRRRVGKGLVVAELAIAVPLLLAMTLVLQHLRALTTADLGFSTDRLLTMRIDLPPHRFPSEATRAAFVRDLLARVRGLPSVQSAGLSVGFPVGTTHSAWAAARVEASPSWLGDEPVSVAWWATTPGYLETLGVPLLKGRHLGDRDTPAGEPVAVVNRGFVERHWPDDGGLGRAIVLDPGTPDERRVTVVGIVGDAGLGALGAPPSPLVFLPHEQRPEARLLLAARITGAPDRAAGQVRAAVRAADPEVPVSDILTANGIARRWLRDDEVVAWVLTGMGALALALGTMGLYGLMSQTVVERQREIGVRLALGATRLDVARLLLVGSARLALVGLAIGVVLSVPVGLAFSAEFYGTARLDAPALGIVAGLLLAVGVAAGLVPARRAAWVEPMTSLRCE